MPTNRGTLDFLFETGQIDLRRGQLFDVSPGPMPQDVDFERVEGLMLGQAIGDGLGNTTEGMLPEQRLSLYGEIRSYLPNPYESNRPVGLPSDDSQLAFWTLDQMISDQGFDPANVADRFTRGRIFGIGATVSKFVANYRSRSLPWYRCGVKSAGNGALMRIAPMLIPHLKTGTSDLWVDTALSAIMTHNDSASTSACLAFTHMLWHLLQMKQAPDPEWWLKTYVSIAKDLETDDSYRPRGGAFAGYQGTMWRFTAERVEQAYREGLSVLDACGLWYSGAYLLETIPSVLLILMRHGDNPEEAIVRAVNDTLDNDTIAAIVGAAVGALHGKGSIPPEWLSNLAGRTTSSDDGKVFHVLDQAKKLWWH